MDIHVQFFFFSSSFFFSIAIFVLSNCIHDSFTSSSIDINIYLFSITYTDNEERERETSVNYTKRQSLYLYMYLFVIWSLSKKDQSRLDYNNTLLYSLFLLCFKFLFSSLENSSTYLINLHKKRMLRDIHSH